MTREEFDAWRLENYWKARDLNPQIINNDGRVLAKVGTYRLWDRVSGTYTQDYFATIRDALSVGNPDRYDIVEASTIRYLTYADFVDAFNANESKRDSKELPTLAAIAYAVKPTQDNPLCWSISTIQGDAQ